MATTEKKKTAFEAPRQNLWLLNPEELQLITDEKDPLYDPRVSLPALEGLVLSIMRRGVIEPVIIQKRDGQAVVVDGRQRVKAAREANKRLKKEGAIVKRVPCKLEVVAEAADVLGLMFSANEHRTDDSPIEKAKKAARLLQAGYSEEEIAVEFGLRSAQTVKNWLSLLDVAPAVRKAIERGEVAPTVAAKVAKLPHAEQLAAIQRAQGARKKRPTVAAVQREARSPDRPARMRNRAELEATLKQPHLPDGWSACIKWVLRCE